MTTGARLANEKTADFEALFPRALDFFDTVCLHLERYDIHVPSELDLKLSSGLFPYYNFEDGNIYVAIPDQSTGTGKLHKIFMRSLLMCQDDRELITLFEVFIPFMISHELGHALRHRSGLYDPSASWEEEQIANQFAMAIIQRHISLSLKLECRRLIYRALINMGDRFKDQTAPGSSHHSLLDALHTEGEITDQTLDDLQVMEKLFAAQPEDILLNSSGTGPLLTERLNQREKIVQAFNDNSADDVTRYMYYLLGWLYYNLTSPQDIYLDEFARLHLGHVSRILPSVEVTAEPTLEEIHACYRAAMLIRPISEIGYRYFYKRYRALVLDKLRRQTFNLLPRIDEETIDFFESWEDDETDTLNYLSQFVPPELRAILPGNLGSEIGNNLDPASRLPTQSDRRLWAYIVDNKPDMAAAETLQRLELLEQIPIFRSLPAEILLTLAENFYRVKLDTGEALIRQDDTDRNVYILLDGTFDVFVTNSAGKLQHLHTIGRGTILGEVAFFTRQPRSASVIAASPSTCYILKANDLRFLLYKYPIIAIEIGTALAHKLQETTTLVQESNFSNQ
jgi:hypothetical protein